MTRITALRGDLSDEKADLIVHFQFEGAAGLPSVLDPRLRESLSAVLKLDGFEGKSDSSVLWHADGHLPAARYLVAGLGRRDEFDRETLYRIAAGTGARARSLQAHRVGVAIPPSGWGLPSEDSVRMVAGGFLHGCYRFEKYRTTAGETKGPAELLVGVPKSDPRRFEKVLEEVRTVDRSLRLARDLVTEHPGFLTPPRMAMVARQEARKAGISCRVLREAEMRRLGMGGMLGVSRGSEHPAEFIHLRHAPKTGARKRAKVVLVGKGVTFDTGGISLKQADGMEAMKADMAGAAAVLSTMVALPALRLPIEVHGLLLMVENMPDGRAIRPGDILRMYNGKTVEIRSTDAEGRLILADGLSWACRNLKPDYLVDLATLTGACVVALGPGCTGMMGNDQRFVRRLLRSAEEAGEKMWPLPLVPEYREHIHSDVADMKNSGIRYGGAITAGLFLQEFVDREVPWIHLDIAGPAFFENGYSYAPKGATGHGVRTLLRFLQSLAG